MKWSYRLVVKDLSDGLSWLSTTTPFTYTTSYKILLSDYLFLAHETVLKCIPFIPLSVLCAPSNGLHNGYESYMYSNTVLWILFGALQLHCSHVYLYLSVFIQCCDFICAPPPMACSNGCESYHVQYRTFKNSLRCNVSLTECWKKCSMKLSREKG